MRTDRGSTVGEPRWLDDEEQRLWRALVAVLTRLPAALEGQLQRDAGLTHFDYWVLALLSEAPDRTLRMSELAARGNASLSRLSHVVSKLERRGWVRREPCPGDARTTLAVLTDTGFDTIVAAAPGHVENVRRLIFDPLSREQLPALQAVLDAWLERSDPAER